MRAKRKKSLEKSTALFRQRINIYNAWVEKHHNALEEIDKMDEVDVTEELRNLSRDPQVKRCTLHA